MGRSARVGSAVWSARTETNTVETWRPAKCEGPFQLALALVSKSGLVPVHARAGAARENQAVQGRGIGRGMCAGRGVSAGAAHGGAFRE